MITSIMLEVAGGGETPEDSRERQAKNPAHQGGDHNRPPRSSRRNQVSAQNEAEGKKADDVGNDVRRVIQRRRRQNFLGRDNVALRYVEVAASRNLVMEAAAGSLPEEVKREQTIRIPDVRAANACPTCVVIPVLLRIERALIDRKPKQLAAPIIVLCCGSPGDKCARKHSVRDAKGGSDLTEIPVKIYLRSPLARRNGDEDRLARGEDVRRKAGSATRPDLDRRRQRF